MLSCVCWQPLSPFTHFLAHLAEAKALRAFADRQEQPLLQFLLALVLGQIQLIETGAPVQIHKSSSVSVIRHQLHHQVQSSVHQPHVPGVRRRERVRVAVRLVDVELLRAAHALERLEALERHLRRARHELQK